MDESPYGREDSKPTEIAEVKMLANRLNQIMARLAVFYIFLYIRKKDANNILSGDIGFKFRYRQRKKYRKAKTITDTLIII